MNNEPQKQVTAIELLQSRKAEFIKVIPKHLNPERVLRIAEGAIRRNRRLLSCSGTSLLRSVLEASAMGLEIGILGDGWLVPYKNECQFQPGYQGLIRLAIQSKAVTSINVGAVRKGDAFDFALGSDPFVHHKISMNGDPEEKPYAVYCVITLINGGKPQVTVMSAKDVDRIRGMSKAKDDGPWVSHYEQMAIKTCIKRALKNVPKSPEVSRAVAYDDRAETGQSTIDLFTPEEIPPELIEEHVEEKLGVVEQVIDAAKKGK